MRHREILRYLFFVITFLDECRMRSKQNAGDGLQVHKEEIGEFCRRAEMFI